MTPIDTEQGVPGDITLPAPAPRQKTSFDRILERALVEVDLGLPSGVRLGVDITDRDAVGIRGGLGIAAARGAPAAGVLGVFMRYHLTKSGDTWVEPTVGIAFLRRGQGALGGIAIGHELLEKDGMQPAISVLAGADLTFVNAQAWALPELALAATW